MGRKRKSRPMHFFRSEPMTMCEICLHLETAFDCMYALGQIGKVQFIHEREEYVSGQFNYGIERCNWILSNIAFIGEQLKLAKMEVAYKPSMEQEPPPKESILSVYENELVPKVAELRTLSHNILQLQAEESKHLELLEVLNTVTALLHGTSVGYTTGNISELRPMDVMLVGDGEVGENDLNYVVGTVLTKKFASFERVIYRVCRGMYHMKSQQLATRDKQLKTVFLVFFIGQQLHEKIKQICNGYEARMIECPASNAKRLAMQIKTKDALHDIKEVLKDIELRRQVLLRDLANDYLMCKANTTRIMAIYVELNKMEPVHDRRRSNLKSHAGHEETAHAHKKYLVCMCWIPTGNIDFVRDELTLPGSNSKFAYLYPGIITEVKPKFMEAPPTHFALNNFTRGFQNLIDAYGLANYGELNPAPYTIVTFPFLFAVMFGDIGHGLIMAIFATALIWKGAKEEKRERPKIRSEIESLIFGGRYIILAMGLFSIYTGFIYNDLFSKSLNILGSHWYVDPPSWMQKNLDMNPESSAHYRGDPYFFGMDPVWKISGDSYIVTVNSIKMKIAIILGVIHMIFGLVLATANQIHLKYYSDLIMVTVPQLVFFFTLFFYLIVLIFYKWVHFGGHNPPPHNTACAPSILITFIDMFLMKPAFAQFPGCNETMFENQILLQRILIFVAFLCVPFLLISKPAYLIVQRIRLRRIRDQKSRKRLTMSVNNNVRRSLVYQVEDLSPRKSSVRLNVEDLTVPIVEYDMMEVWIHSGIHTIDSVLGAISHTASYLRLWALSLAHEQLSHVLWMMVLKRGFGTEYYYSAVLFATFAVWAVLTVAILVTMEALSAFLHTLRLHWVEFQSKFYEGAGEPFKPFRFEKVSKYL